MGNERMYNRSDVRVRGARRRLRLLFIAVLGFCGWAAVTLWHQEGAVQSKTSQLEVLEGKLAEVQDRHEQYKQEITRLQDPEYIEQILRKDLHMTKKGETLFIEAH